MRFGVLGSVTAWTDDGDAVRIPELKVRALLADLVAHRGWPVSVDRLVEDVWGAESAPAHPERALQRKVWALRQALEAAEPGARDLVRYRPPGYLLDAPAEAVDAERFQELVGTAQRSGDARNRARTLTAALDLWRGPAYADIADQEFVRPTLTRLEERRLVALEELALARLDQGEYRQVTEELGALVGAHPLRERLVAAHMRALYEGGRQAEALEAHTALARRLREELGVDPGAEVSALHGRILRAEPVTDRAETAAPESATAAGRAPEARPEPVGETRPEPQPAGPDPAPGRSSRPRLPLPLTDLLGRDREAADVRRLLGEGRLVTLTGFGGVGKTRLATALAHELDGAYADGVHMVEFAGQRPLQDKTTRPDPAQTLAHALGVRDSGEGDTVHRLLCALTDRDMLLVLDNCEHVAAEVADLAAALLGRLPGLRVLATSREPLDVPGEVLYGLDPLSVPTARADLAEISGSSAVRLFVARAAATAPGFELDADNAADVAQLCRRLDGIPLALELAATRVRALGVGGVLCRLDDRFRLLSTAKRHLPLRQQTLRAMIDWSWELLGDDERVLLRRLAVFTGGCALVDAEAVCSSTGLRPDDVLDLLSRLVDRSLVVAADDPLTGRRYNLLESIAEYACERLYEAGEAYTVQARHARHYTGLAEHCHGLLFGGDQGYGLRRLDTESANLTAALNHAVGDGAADLALGIANALGWYWYLRGRYREGRRLIGHALTVDNASEVPLELAAANANAVVYATLAGSNEHAHSARAALKAFDDLAAPPGEDVVLHRAHAAWMLGFTLFSRGDPATSEELVSWALATFRDRDDRWGLAASLAARASHALGRGDMAGMGDLASEALELFDEVGDCWGTMTTQVLLGTLAEARGDYAQATRLRRSALAAAEELHLWAEAAGALSGLGRIALLEGDFARADELHHRALDLIRGQGDMAGQQYAQIGLGLSARRQGRLEEAEQHLHPIADWAADVGWHPGAALALAELGFVAELRGDADRALDLHLQGLANARRSGDPRALALAFEGVAGARTLTGHHGAAARLLGTASAARERAGTPIPGAERGDVDRASDRARKALGGAAFDRAFAEGRERTPDELMDGTDAHPGLSAG